MKKQNIITLLSFIAVAFSANAVDKYVTENVDIYLRRGPGSQYAYSNAVKAGQKVIELEKSADGKYTRIQLPSGNSAWIESNKLKDQPSFKELVPSLEAQLAEYKDKVDNAEKNQQNAIRDYAEKLQKAEQTIESLQAKNNELEQLNKQQDMKLESMLNQVDDKRRDLIVTWFTYGGLVAGGGFLLGLILPAIMPGRRKKDRWMR
ncbi:TIGR04211 family SH3 domain-containing protein [Gilliamella sp. B14384H2]|uniref:TIGR04211 family SH3 domain-containing protein n=1 Tax=unclassified Gilliamella TaxID=2685620 RepID=UPI0018DB92BA|nr:MULTISPECIES: TIGR04211 family SH3 domain-containing protein [unclassified Gilliamella]MBI0037122.1 TIGR04211 family SH3 domain-containing protein [Gilliamella sp. B14384G10]MBI0039224.1 TIGR04211 family SH3 domain-containing protein [Gilliamella sp. B14384G7]MBI0051117.1 TIGR04211 family SH3 domain-containing protein [Gilliamella sp. B14384G13]MBI0053409.1 TIGR04211 family SH3 domain-containing protein [Gilliamella sp. B14384H2]